jgi:hypothetical protein
MLFLPENGLYIAALSITATKPWPKSRKEIYLLQKNCQKGTISKPAQKAKCF